MTKSFRYSRTDSTNNLLILFALHQEWDRKCYYHGKVEEHSHLQIDHLIPKSKQKDYPSLDLDALENLAPICGQGNQQKGNREDLPAVDVARTTAKRLAPKVQARIEKYLADEEVHKGFLQTVTYLTQIAEIPPESEDLLKDATPFLARTLLRLTPERFEQGLSNNPELLDWKFERSLTDYSEEDVCGTTRTYLQRYGPDVTYRGFGYEARWAEQVMLQEFGSIDRVRDYIVYGLGQAVDVALAWKGLSDELEDSGYFSRYLETPHAETPPEDSRDWTVTLWNPRMEDYSTFVCEAEFEVEAQAEATVYDYTNDNSGMRTDEMPVRVSGSATIRIDLRELDAPPIIEDVTLEQEMG